MAIRNPVEWSADQFRQGTHAVGSAGRAAVYGTEGEVGSLTPSIRRIAPADLMDALAKGRDDFMAYRTDVIFVCLIYPIVGIVLARAAAGRDMLQLLFPMASGFALIGPFAAIGLYEMSRRRERGETITWKDAFGVLNSPAFGSILALGVILFAVFVAWLFAAQAVYENTLGPEAPASVGSFLREVFTTGEGWRMIILGFGIGFLFAVVAFSISVVSFPMLLDRKGGVGTAISTSLRAVAANPVTMALWGLIVALSLAIGSIPVFVGLIIVMPILGHATWHLYRKVVAFE
jgi:uncharacterized membrane protein